MAETNYSELYTKKYSDMMRLNLIQHPSLLAGLVGHTKTGIVGEAYLQSYVGKRTMSENTDPKGNTPDNGNTLSLRTMKGKNFHDGILHNRKFKHLSIWGDEVGSLTVEGMKQAAHDTIDTVISTALIGSALVGKNETATALPASQKIAANYTRATTAVDSGLTVEKLRKAKTMLTKAGVLKNGKDLYGKAPNVLVSASMVNDLLDDPNLTDAQRTQVNMFVDGEPKNFLGFNIVQYEGLPLDSTTKVSKCIVFTSSAISYGLWENISVSFDKRPDKQNNIQTYCEFNCGAVRTMEEGVVEISCKCADDE